MREQQPFDIRNCTILAETYSAIKVALEDGECIWLPLSQVEAIHRGKTQGEDWIVCSRWIAEKKGLL